MATCPKAKMDGNAMAQPLRKTEYEEGPQPDGFDVMVVRSIGRVEFDSLGILSPVEAAYAIIARDGAEPGEYRFPHSDGGTVVVSIAHERT